MTTPDPDAVPPAPSIDADIGELRGTSLEKFHACVAAVSMHEPADEETARLLALFQMAQSSGLIGMVIPPDSETFDDALLRVARVALQMRSDDATVEPEQASELLDLLRV